MAAAKFKRGDVVRRPDAWAPRAPHTKMRKGRAIVLKATARKLVLCTFQPGARVDGRSNPHVGQYTPKGIVKVGHVKKMPKVCGDVLKWKTRFWAEHPSFNRPRDLAGRKRARR